MTARPATASAAQLRPASRYRHPGDVIRLIAGSHWAAIRYGGRVRAAEIAGVQPMRNAPRRRPPFENTINGPARRCGI
jgi:hypothetical protein